MPRRSPLKKSTAAEAQGDSLAELQRAITGALFRPLNGDETMQPAGALVAERFIKPNERMSAAERLQIYNQQYWWRLLGSFGEDFRGLRAVLGERKFDRLAVAYLEACGSQSWNLRDVGARLPAFIAEHPPLTQPHTALAFDVARVEWARITAFDDPEKPVLTPVEIAQQAPDGLRLSLQPYLVLLELSHPVDELMARVKRTTIAAVSNAVAQVHTTRRQTLRVRPSSTPIHLAVHRVQFSVYYKRLDPQAYRLLSALRAGTPLEEACALAFAESKEAPEQSAARIQEWFARWMEFGWFCR